MKKLIKKSELSEIKLPQSRIVEGISEREVNVAYKLLSDLIFEETIFDVKNYDRRSDLSRINFIYHLVKAFSSTMEQAYKCSDPLHEKTFDAITGKQVFGYPDSPSLDFVAFKSVRSNLTLSYATLIALQILISNTPSLNKIANERIENKPVIKTKRKLLVNEKPIGYAKLEDVCKGADKLKLLITE